MKMTSKFYLFLLSFLTILSLAGIPAPTGSAIPVTGLSSLSIIANATSPSVQSAKESASNSQLASIKIENVFDLPVVQQPSANSGYVSTRNNTLTQFGLASSYGSIGILANNYLAGKYHRPIIHFLFRMVRNQAIAEELAQEVFLRVYRSRASYRAEAKFSTWLYRIATNLAVNQARDTKNERAVQSVYLDAPDGETGTKPDVADIGLSAEQSLLRQERMKAIRAQVRSLPERQRMAVLLHKYQGMDYREIGEVLKLSESAVKSLLFRAYQSLRESLKDFV